MAAIAGSDLSHGTVRAWRKRFSPRNDAGAELIEFAFVLPLLLLVIVGIFDFGFLFQQYEVVTNAAREGARAAVLPDYQDNADAVRARVQQYLNQAGLPGTVVACGAPPCADVTFGMSITDPINNVTITASQVTVQYSHQYLFLGPIATLFGGNFTSITLRATSTMRREAL